MLLLVGMGERMSERFLPVYMMAMGGGAISIGILSGLDNLLSALYLFPGGYLSDRIGTKRALLVFNLVAIAGFLIVILIPAWQAVIAGSVLFISWSSVSLPATMGLISRVLPAGKRTMGVSMHSLVNRIPMAVGPVLGGFCIAAWGEADGVRWAFGFALLFAVLSYFFYLFAVGFLAASVGCLIGFGIMSALGITNWLAWLVALVVGFLVAFVVLRLNVQKYVVIIFTAILGAGVTVFGLLLPVGALTIEDFATGTPSPRALPAYKGDDDILSSRDASGEDVFSRSVMRLTISPDRG